MQISIENFRGCGSAKIEVAPIALVAGENAAGKSSVAQGVAATLTGSASPVAGLGKNVGALVRTGAAKATVLVGNADGQVRLEWPDGVVTTAGNPPDASAYATGLESLATMPPKEMVRVLAQYLHADPTVEDLDAALNEAGIGIAAADKVWPLIERHGWDGARDELRDTGAQLKGQWRGKTGSNYGSRIGATWRIDLADLDEDRLIGAVANAQSVRDRAIRSRAVSDAERERFISLADQYDDRKETVNAAQDEVERALAKYRDAQAERAKLPTGTRQGKPLRCPHCGGNFEIVDGMAVAVEVEGRDAVRQRRMAIAEAEGHMANANDYVMRSRAFLAERQRELHESDDARQRLEHWPRAVETGLDLDAAEAELSRHNKRLDEFRTKIEADRLHALIETNEVLIGLVSADGLRARKLARVLDVFNRDLDMLCEEAGWLPVNVDAHGLIAYGNRPYPLLSDSEKFRVRVVLAVTMAKLDGSSMVIVDGADILDTTGRNGLFTLLQDVNIPALVCMTIAKRELMPDLAKRELGQSYWLTGGNVAAE
jgi:hypothetical protein